MNKVLCFLPVLLLGICCGDVIDIDFLGIHLGMDATVAEARMMASAKENNLPFSLLNKVEGPVATTTYYRGSHRLRGASYTSVKHDKSNRVFMIVVGFSDERDPESLIRVFRIGLEKKYAMHFSKGDGWQTSYRLIWHGKMQVLLFRTGLRDVVVGALHERLHEEASKQEEAIKVKEHKW